MAIFKSDPGWVPLGQHVEMIKFIKKIFEFLSMLKTLIGLFPSLGVALSTLPAFVLAYIYYGNNIILIAIIVELVVVASIVGVFYHNYKLRQKFITEKKQGLIDRGTLVKNVEYATSRKSLFMQRKVFWPVVPNKELNIIHIAHLNTLKYMMKYGFEVYVLVYDLYYEDRRRNEYQETNVKSLNKEVNIFVKHLKKMGLKSTIFNKVSYRYESKLAKKKYHKYYSAVSGEIKLNELESISNKKLSQKTKFYTLRLLKPLSIMSFLISIEDSIPRARIAATLCGVDEKILYEKCRKIMKNKLRDGYVPFQIYIPQFNGFKENSTSEGIPGVLDAQCSLSDDNKANIKFLAKNYRCDLRKKDDSVLFLINHLLFYADDIPFRPHCADVNTPMNRLQFIQKCTEKGCDRISSCVIEGIYDNIVNPQAAREIHE